MKARPDPRAGPAAPAAGPGPLDQAQARHPAGRRPAAAGLRLLLARHRLASRYAPRRSPIARRAADLAGPGARHDLAAARDDRRGPGDGPRRLHPAGARRPRATRWASWPGRSTRWPPTWPRPTSSARELIANVSHELRTPITALQGVLENIVDGVAAPDPATLRTALGQTERLGRLVTELLDLSRIDAGVQPLRRGRGSTSRDFLDEVVAEAAVTRRGAGRDVGFAVRPPAAPVTAHADRERLHQVLANLLDNAARHSPPGGTVRSDRPAPTATGCVIEVADEGPGIPPAERDAGLRAVHPRRPRRPAAAPASAWRSPAGSCELHGGTIAVRRPGPPAAGSGSRLPAGDGRRTTSREERSDRIDHDADEPRQPRDARPADRVPTAASAAGRDTVPGRRPPDPPAAAASTFWRRSGRWPDEPAPAAPRARALSVAGAAGRRDRRPADRPGPRLAARRAGRRGRRSLVGGRPAPQTRRRRAPSAGRLAAVACSPSARSGRPGGCSRCASRRRASRGLALAGGRTARARAGTAAARWPTPAHDARRCPGSPRRRRLRSEPTAPGAGCALIIAPCSAALAARVRRAVRQRRPGVRRPARAGPARRRRRRRSSAGCWCCSWCSAGGAVGARVPGQPRRRRSTGSTGRRAAHRAPARVAAAGRACSTRCSRRSSRCSSRSCSAATSYVLRTAGLTYAEYARGGFWQLLVVTGLTLAVIAVAARKAPRETGGRPGADARRCSARSPCSRWWSSRRRCTGWTPTSRRTA